MDPTLYIAAMEGNVQILMQNSDQLEVQVTPNGNTILHIVAMYGKDECIEVILRNFPSLLTRLNVNGKTALHIAAREGHLAATRVLITLTYEQYETNIFGLTSNDGNTALHEAVQFCHPAVAKLLLEQDPEFPHQSNKANETPLYLAAKNRLDDCVSYIIETCKSPSYSGPIGQNALHAAVIFNSQESTMNLLRWKPMLSEEADEMGWTPFHYAADLGHVERVSQLLNFNKRVAYATTKIFERTTALHLAASHGHINVIREIISHCPDCSEMVNSRGQNILHIALQNNAEEVIEFILETPLLMNLISQEDDQRNTPMHLLEASNFHHLQNHVTHPKARLDFDKIPSQQIIANSENYSQQDSKAITDEINVDIGKDQIITVNKERTSHFFEGQRTYIKRLYSKSNIGGTKKMGKTNLIVAALVATVAFTAGFTLPGGYNQGDSKTSADNKTIHGSSDEEGMAVLGRHMAFQVFIIADTIALLLSTCAIFIYIGLNVDENENVLINLTTRTLVLLAIDAMMAAFVFGTYAVLERYSGLAIAVGSIGCSSFLIHIVIVCSPSFGKLNWFAQRAKVDQEADQACV